MRRSYCTWHSDITKLKTYFIIYLYYLNFLPKVGSNICMTFCLSFSFDEWFSISTIIRLWTCVSEECFQCVRFSFAADGNNEEIQAGSGPESGLHRETPGGSSVGFVERGWERDEWRSVAGGGHQSIVFLSGRGRRCGEVSVVSDGYFPVRRSYLPDLHLFC